jgi:hypothetical protein
MRKPLGSARGSRAVFGRVAEHPNVHYPSPATGPPARPLAAAREAACAPEQFATCAARFVTELFFVQLSLPSG